VWLRLQALSRSKYNDSVWVQFSNATVNGAPAYEIGSSSGLLVNLATDSAASSLNAWGWQNTAYWLSQATTISFSTSGAQTMRLQVREDGVQFDQIVLSPSQYLSSPPGPVTNDFRRSCRSPSHGIPRRNHCERHFVSSNTRIPENGVSAGIFLSIALSSRCAGAT
jgi:hypothetical protein